MPLGVLTDALIDSIKPMSKRQAWKESPNSDCPRVEKEPTSACAPFVSVIVPVYQDLDHLPRLLGAMERQSYPANNFETLIVFNDRNECPSRTLGTDVSVRFLTEEIPGSYAARNKGIANARGRVLAFTDVDCVPDRDWLKIGVEALNENLDRGYVGGKIEIVSNSGPRPTIAERYETSVHFRQDLYVKDGHFAATANMFTTRDVIDRIGMFNPNLKSSGDKEWGERAASSGFQGFHESRAIVGHPGRSLGELLRKARRLAGGRVDYQRLKSASREMLHHCLIFDWKSEFNYLRGRWWLIRDRHQSDVMQALFPGLFSLLVFAVALMERWRIRLGATSLRT